MKQTSLTNKFIITMNPNTGKTSWFMCYQCATHKCKILKIVSNAFKVIINLQYWIVKFDKI